MVVSIGSDKMDIKRIKIDGFKNLRNVELKLDNITSLLSINSYGKTNTLKALVFGVDFIIKPSEIKSNQMKYAPGIPANLYNVNNTFSFEIETELEGEEIIYGYK